MTYTLPDSWERARPRLPLLQDCHDPATARRPAALGTRPGQRRFHGPAVVAAWGRVPANG